MAEPTFRLAIPTDLPVITDILNQAIRAGGQNAYTETVDLANRQAWLTTHKADAYPVFLIEVGEQIAGWCSFSPYRAGRASLAGCVEITYYLDQSWQGKGIGTQTLQFLMAEGRRRHYHHLLAVLMDTNVASIRLLEKLAFQCCARLPNIARVGGNTHGQLWYMLALE